LPVALLGKRDEPTDAVEQYCRCLSEALGAHNISLHLRRVEWRESGWKVALNDLRAKAKSWRGMDVLVQYTALGWSRRGFPFRFLSVLRELRRADVLIAIVFHDVEPYSGTRIVDKLRRSAQTFVMRRALGVAQKAIFTIPVDKVSWLKRARTKSVFIPIGSNILYGLAGTPSSPDSCLDTPSPSRIPTIAVFSVTEGLPGKGETKEILTAVSHAAARMGILRLIVFGRGAMARKPALEEGLKGTSVQLQVEDLLDEQQVAERMRSADLLLFVRGPISSKRGSALAGVAFGLPIIAYEGRETAFPMTDAGVLLVPYSESADVRQTGLNEALLRVLSDDALRRELAERSRRAFQRHFSWNSISSQFSQVLTSAGTTGDDASLARPLLPNN
jgi:glycosyltransferase involved in cell wall biosynthesis